MKRRHVVMLFGFLSLGATAAPWRRQVSLWRPASGEHITRTMEALADLMFPGDGLPGAAALGLHSRVLSMPGLKAQIARGVTWLDKYAASRGASNFLALNEADRLTAVDAAFASYNDGMQQFVRMMRFHFCSAYYANSLVKAAFPYTGPPQPNGFPDFQEPPA